jgi:hypothetical protein
MILLVYTDRSVSDNAPVLHPNPLRLSSFLPSLFPAPLPLHSTSHTSLLLTKEQGSIIWRTPGVCRQRMRMKNSGWRTCPSSTSLCRYLNSTWILTAPLLLSTTNQISQKFIYILYSHDLIQEKLDFDMPLSLCDDMLQLPPRVHQKTDPKWFPFLSEIRVDFQTPKDNTTNCNPTVSNCIQNHTFPQFDGIKVWNPRILAQNAVERTIS